jgi:hypothetical protein
MEFMPTLTEDKQRLIDNVSPGDIRQACIDHVNSDDDDEDDGVEVTITV